MTDILDLEGWTPTNKHTDGDEYVIEAEYTVPPKACTKCGNIGNLYKHGPKPIYIRDSPIRGRPVRILANAQRFKCRECGGTFIQPLGGIHPDSRMTSRCVEFIQAQCLRQPFLHIAELVGCDDKTIRNLAGDYIDRLNAEYRPWLPEWLGIDETQIDGKLRCIITDVVNRLPIDMLPDRDKPSVTSWLYQFKDKRVVNTCASCGGIYDTTDLHLTRMGPMFDGEPELNLVVMCGHCKVRFHMERANGHQSASTR